MTATATRPKTRRPRRTADQKRAEMEALHEKLSQSVEALRGSQQWTEYLRFCRSFHRYSLNNLLLILSQKPEATHVAGYQRWQDLGRQVRAGQGGANAIRIFGGRERMVTEEDDNGDETTRRRVVFFPVSVFDISQTDPIEGREDVTTVTRNLTGDDERGILSRVVDYLTASGIPVTFQEIASAANGYTKPADPKTGAPIRVVIEDRNAPAQQAKTALHEAAHIILGHLADDYSEYLAHRGRYEIEAESVAYVVAGILGLDSSDYSTGYVATWAEKADADVIKGTAERVLAAVRTLVEALSDQGEEQGRAA